MPDMNQDTPHTIPETKRPTTDLSRFKVVKGNRGSARGDLLDRFLERLNPPRKEAGYKPYTHARLSLMLQHITAIDDLHAFYDQCDKAGIPFSAYFHWALKPKKPRAI
jgi:hypothetical protein